MRKPVDIDQFIETMRQLRMHWLMLNVPSPQPNPGP
jgi:hypothetical protein